jgi:drug/metabolite transporter (DMT)-like permease
MILAAATLWGISATIARLAFRDHGVPPLTMVEMRLLIACALLLPWLAWRQRAALRVLPTDRAYFVVLGLLGVAAVQGTYYLSIAHLGVGPAILLQYFAPALIVAYEMARGRPASVQLLAAVASATVGTALLVGGLRDPAFHPTPLDWAIGFASALSFAFYIGFSKRGLARYAPATLLFYNFAVAAVFWMIVTPPWKILAAHYGPDVWALFLLVGVFSTLVPFALFTAGMRRLRPAETGVLATIEPVVAISLAAIFLGEGLRPLQWIGAALVIGATLLSALAGSASAEEVAVARERP